MTSQLFQNGSDSFISWFGLPNPNQEIGLSLDELPFQFILVAIVNYFIITAKYFFNIPIIFSFIKIQTKFSLICESGLFVSQEELLVSESARPA
jgi:hypothetical protein